MQILFWSLIGLVVYAYVGYPLILWLWKLSEGRHGGRGGAW